MRGLMKLFLCVLLLALAVPGFAQTDSAPPQTQQAPVQQPVARRQTIDSTLYKDSIRNAELAAQLRDSLYTDSVKKAAIPVITIDTTTYRRFAPAQWLPVDKEPVYMIIDYRVQPSKDDLFYLVAGIILVLACIRAAFSKYFRNMFLLFMQTSLRQKQTRDQLLQDNLASLLTNFLFVVTGGLYITLFLQYKGWSDLPFWWLAAGSAGALLLIYLGKFLFLLFSGWLFNTKEAAGSYAFVVFLVNKVLGVVLVPFVIVFAFAAPEVVQVAITVSAVVVLLLLGYRYWVSFVSIRGKLKVNALHFFTLPLRR